ncbi:MAG: hypothetical protein K0R71_1336 [Bacillales bacterium]|jgi:uncharacterized membrane protein YdjX (TVP38/TMEM64 family)|nr:hypothetical protein [Bacillales bacterium]
MLKRITLVYNSFIFAFVLALSVFSNTNLEMMINTGQILIGSFFILVVIGLIIQWRGKLEIGFITTVSNIIIWGVYIFFLIGNDPMFGNARFATLPASIIREGIHQTSIPFSTINYLLLSWLILGFIAIIFLHIKCVRKCKTPYQMNISWKAVSFNIFLAVVFSAFFQPQLSKETKELGSMLGSMDVDRVIEYIRSFGGWAAGVSFLLMLLQSVLAPIPAVLITFSNAAVFGWWQGAILSWSSAMAGAVLCFYIARFFGRGAVVKLTSNTLLKQVDDFFARYGKHTVIICRLLPFVSFDIISYGAGLTSMGFWEFFVATGVGQLPATIVYSYVGGMLTGSAKMVLSGILILFSITILVFIIKTMYKERSKKK